MQTGQALDGLPVDCRPETLSEAYAIQELFVGQLGTPVGYKIGFTNPAIQAVFNLDAPVSGRLLEGRIHENGKRLDSSRLLMRVAEPEFAFRMGRDLPRSGAPFHAQRVADAIEAAIPALEIVESRLRNWTRIGALQAVADNAVGCHWVGGDAEEDWTPAALEDQEIIGFVNGVEVTRGRGANVLGGPLRALVWLANDLAVRGQQLAKGDLITTGCCTEVIDANPGDTVEADFGRFGRVRMEFGA